MKTEVSYIPYATSSKEKTDNIITFEQFDESNLLFESHNCTESGDEADENSTLPLLISEGKLDEMSSGGEYGAETMSTDMLDFFVAEGNIIRS